MSKITLITAIHLLQSMEAPALTIVERPRGYALDVDGNLIRSQREAELSFLTYDAAVNYAKRHLAPQLALPLTISLVLPPAG